MASSSLRGRVRDDAPGRRYVASLIWQGRLPTPANENRRVRRLVSLHRLLPLAASLALLAAGLSAAASQARIYDVRLTTAGM